MQRVVRVLVDEPAIDREFFYLLPEPLAAGRVPVSVGTLVRVVLNRRRLRGWVTELDSHPPDGLELTEVSGVVGVGPPPHVVELAEWAAWRWAGTRVHFLRTASADRVVAGLPLAPAQVTKSDEAQTPAWLAVAFEPGGDAARAVRLGPCADEWPLVSAALERGRVLVLVPTVSWAARLAGRLRHAGVATALFGRDWAGAAAAQAVVGAMTAAWAPCARLDSVIVFDEHDQGYQSEAAPTWNARDVAVERAQRDGARCLLVGPMPSPDALRAAGVCDGGDDEGDNENGTAAAVVLRAPVPDEREAWPMVQVADRRQDDPAMGEWCGTAFAELLRAGGNVVCVLNRKGRARLAYCASCGALACSPAGRALALDGQRFVDPESGDVRPAVCEECGATRFRRVRVGVKGVADEMERLARRAVTQVVGESPVAPAAEALYIGTEAVLHRVPAADAVVFVDFDQELTAPRYRAAEEAFALLVRAARLVGPHSGGGRILVQTRMPDHPVLVAAESADPADFVNAEVLRRSQMRQPPSAAWALVSGAAAQTYVERLSNPADAAALDIAGPANGVWRVRCDDSGTLLDALAAKPRPPGRLRVAVDPLRA
ncbi:hypothetical protein [Candidatus Poriferisodalis sp.]|uniref:primosomal protein N' family DNA-binding protein n=1 Tax=Candidatus Poriferisodalis sp. TaxID=3101277 RepID=UPI003B02AAD4